MIREARELPPKSQLRADVCVVGAGPAGIALSRRLAQRGVRVLLLESGHFRPEASTQELARGEVLGELYWSLETSRVRAFGGSSQHWTGWCRPLDALDFEHRPWVEHSGWPITLDDLRDFYRHAHELVDLGNFDYEPATWAKALERTLFSLEGTDLRTCIWQLSRPTHFGEKYRAEFEQSRELDVWLGATVLALVRDPRRQRVERVDFATPDGHVLSAHAQKFVLAAGGIDNARLLLASEHAGVGIGNEHDLVGRFFIEHPHANVGILQCQAGAEVLRLYEAVQDAPGGRPAAVRAAIAPSEEIQRHERTLNFSVCLEPLLRVPPYAPSHAEASRALARVRGVAEERAFELFVRAEQQPSPESRVTLARTRDRFGVPQAALDWRHHPLTLRSIRQNLELVAQALGRLGVGHVYSYIHADPRPPGMPPGCWPELWGGHHHMGTTRMHPDPRSGVVDPNCRVHSLENLFIAGSSVFPTGGYANPTLTLVALALRLADHLTKALS
jgi:choline dehydrogenase-like flavoprotein